MSPEFYRKQAQWILVVVAVLGVFGFAFFVQFRQELTLDRVLDVQRAVQDVILAPEAEKPLVSKPPPLRAPILPEPVGEEGNVSVSPAPSPSPTSAPSYAPNKYTLTRAGILARTNAERAENGGLPPLAGDAVLDAIAVGRLEDMFAKQYFAHVAPDDGQAETVAKTVGYEFLALGENLALGNYEGDAGVVTAWMESPGHRANILNDGYTELGIAARKGMYEGHETWLAVQIFARPASDCPAPDKALSAEIDSEKAMLAQQEDTLNAKKAELEAMQPKRGPAYNQKVAEYNELVEQYNALVADIKVDIAAYNAGVSAFNQCVGM
jgi:uncharacterized protein YkwD